MSFEDKFNGKKGEGLKFENTPILQMGRQRFRTRWQLACIWSLSPASLGTEAALVLLVE